MADNNLAYDLSVYEPRTAYQRKAKTQQEPQILPKRQITVINNPAFHEVKKAMSYFLTGLVLLAFMCALIYSKIETNRAFNQVNQLQSQLSSLQAQNSELASQYQAATALGNVEEYAQETLGLTKLDKSQIAYVEVESETVIEVVDSSGGSVLLKLSNAIRDFLEYIGL
ncbi:MAG: hypothetical protein IKU89_01530 [Oscillospiraceae bacterium]|nr:hypothetical protein [Oscillospiraceae bacterium]